MELTVLPYRLSVCKLYMRSDFNAESAFYFFSKTDEELSLVCKTEDAPERTIAREDGWKAFRIRGVLDFSLIGILSKLTSLLAQNTIGVFAVSTFNTDYVLIQEKDFDRALEVLSAAGYTISRP